MRWQNTWMLDEPVPVPMRIPLHCARYSRLHMVPVNVRVAHLEDELVRLGAGDLGDHVGEERVAGNVERDTETQVA